MVKLASQAEAIRAHGGGNVTVPLATEPAWYRPKSLSELCELAQIIARSSLCPTTFRGNPNDVLVALMMGAELGLSPMQALQNIAVLNGRPALWGDAMLAVCKQAAPFEYCQESISGLLEDGSLTAICRVKRRGEPEAVRTFSLQDAKAARLLDKLPWQQYPKRMVQMRARGFALRDVFPDVLRGMWVAEEARDLDPAVTEGLKHAAREAPKVLPAQMAEAERILHAVEAAHSMQALTDAVAEVSKLRQQDKDQVRAAYRRREKALRTAQPPARPA